MPTAVKLAADLEEAAPANLPLAPAEITAVTPLVEPPAAAPAGPALRVGSASPAIKIAVPAVPTISTIIQPSVSEVPAPNFLAPMSAAYAPTATPTSAMRSATASPFVTVARSTNNLPKLAAASSANRQPPPAEQLPVPSPPPLPMQDSRPLALDEERPISALTTSIEPTSGVLPADAAAARFVEGANAWDTRPWNEVLYNWEAPALCYGPLRYEAVNLERYGYSHCPLLQPALSGAHFFGATLALPYTMTVRPHSECIYPLGHYRPGSPVPYRHIWPEWDPRAANVEAATVAGLILLIP